MPCHTSRYNNGMVVYHSIIATCDRRPSPGPQDIIMIYQKEMIPRGLMIKLQNEVDEFSPPPPPKKNKGERKKEKKHNHSPASRR